MRIPLDPPSWTGMRYFRSFGQKYTISSSFST
jgi:hypothetical protein